MRTLRLQEVRTLSVQRIGSRIARLEPEVLDTLVDGLNEIIGP